MTTAPDTARIDRARPDAAIERGGVAPDGATSRALVPPNGAPESAPTTTTRSRDWRSVDRDATH